MSTLIVQSRKDLGSLWKSHISRFGEPVTLVNSEEDAVDALRAEAFRVIVLDLDMRTGDPFAIADYAGYRQPDAKVLFVTNTSFFSDGSLFRHYRNSCGLVQHSTPPEDLAVMVDHYGRTAR